MKEDLNREPRIIEAGISVDSSTLTKEMKDALRRELEALGLVEVIQTNPTQTPLGERGDNDEVKSPEVGEKDREEIG